MRLCHKFKAFDRLFELITIEGLLGLTPIFNFAWKTRIMPGEWQTKVVFSFYRRGAHEYFLTLGGSHFSDSLKKVSAGILEGNLRPFVQPQIQEEQGGVDVSSLHMLHRSGEAL